MCAGSKDCYYSIFTLPVSYARSFMQNVTKLLLPFNKVYAATYLDESSERQGICFQFSPAKEQLFTQIKNAELKEYAIAGPAEGGKEMFARAQTSERKHLYRQQWK